MHAKESTERGDPSSPSIVVRELHNNAAGGSRDPGRGGDISEFTFSGDGGHLVVGSTDLVVRVWNIYSGELELLAPPLAGSNDEGGYHAGHLSCDILQNPMRGLLLAAGGTAGGVFVWDVRRRGPGTGSTMVASGGTGPTADLRNNGHEYGISVSHLAAYPDGSFFVSADSSTVKFWSADDFECKRTLRSTFEVEHLMVSAKGVFVFIAGGNSDEGRRTKEKRAVVAVWGGRKRGRIYPGYGGERDPVQLLTGHGGSIRSLYTPDNPDVLVTSALDATVKVWNVPNGTCTKTVWSKGGLHSPLSYAALVNRGAWLLTSHDDNSLQVWDARTGRCVMSLTNTAAAAPSSSATATGSAGAGVRIARLTVSRSGRLAAFAVGKRLKVLDFDRLADRSAAAGGRPGQTGSYLRQALRFVTSPLT